MQPVGGQQPPEQPPRPYPQPYPQPYPPQSPWPYYPPPPPTRRDNLALIIVLVVVLVVLVPVIAAAVLYVMVSELIGSPVVQPTVTFGAVTQRAGNATIPVAYVSANIDPGSLQTLLQANYSYATPSRMPPASGGYVSITTGGRVFRLYWTDADHNGLLSSGDAFLVTGDGVPLPSSTAVTFRLQSPDGRNLVNTEWTTP